MSEKNAEPKGDGDIWSPGQTAYQALIDFLLDTPCWCVFEKTTTRTDGTKVTQTVCFKEPVKVPDNDHSIRFLKPAKRIWLDLPEEMRTAWEHAARKVLQDFDREGKKRR